MLDSALRVAARGVESIINFPDPVSAINHYLRQVARSIFHTVYCLGYKIVEFIALLYNSSRASSCCPQCITFLESFKVMPGVY